MGAFSDALALKPADDDKTDTGRIYVSPDKGKQSPFAAALANKDAPPESPPASFDDRFSAAPEAKKDFNWSDAITDIPNEYRKEVEGGLNALSDVSKRGEQDTIEGLGTTGKALLAPARIFAAPITAVARSVIGHGLTNAEHAAGTVIAPDIAAKDNPDAMYEASKADVDKAMSAVGPREAPVAAAAVPSIQELKQVSIAGFHSPEVNNLVLKPEAFREFSQGSQVELDKLGLDDTVAPKTHAILKKMENAPSNSVVTGRNVVSARRSLQRAASSPDSSERAAAVEAIDHLDDFIPNAGKHVISGDLGKAAATLEEARANYSAAMHAETIDNKTIQAELRAAAANSGMNVSNTIRQRMADILLKPKERRGFTQDQLDQMETIVRGSKTQNAIRMAGNLMGGGGGLGAAVTGGIGALVTPGGVGGLIPVGGIALKSLSNRMTLTQAAKLSASIRSSAPLASSLQKLNQATSVLQQTRNAQTVAGVVLASRNFANNLKGVGINLSPNDIARGLLQAQAAPESKDKKDVPGPVGQ